MRGIRKWRSVWTLLASAVAAVPVTPGAQAQEHLLTASLETTADAYAAGAPVEMLLTLTNHSAVPVIVSERYPRFAMPAHAGIQIKPAEGDASPPPYQSPAPDTNGIVLSLRLDTGQAATYKLYLQRFMPDLPVGTHRLAYSIDIGVGSEVGGRQSAVGTGVLVVAVFPATAAELEKILASYEDGVGMAQAAKSGYWPERAAEEALSVTNLPQVIAHLKQVFAVGATMHDLSPLAKFRGNRDAEDLLLSIIRTDNGNSIPSAMSVLEAWDYALSAEVFGALCSHDDTWPTAELLKYAEKMNQIAYVPAVAGLKESRVPAVAAMASRVERELRASGR